MTKFRILLTTPDYPPQLGGLSTFAVTIENVLKELDFDYELFVWNSVKEIKKYQAKKRFDYVVNVHFMGGFFLRGIKARQINFFHGSEILFYSQNFIKMLYKKIFQRRIISLLERSFLNVFISQATLDLFQKRGYLAGYDRDVIIHNGLKFDRNYIFEKRVLGETIKFVAIARDVPHKNIDGCIRFASKIAALSGREVELYVTSNRIGGENNVKIINISGITNEHREQLYREANFNLLLSLDHSSKGYIEGFGLTVLEAGQYGVPSIVFSNGGLKESVHHEKTGWIVTEDGIEKWWKSLTEQDYSLVCKQCYQHTRCSHDADIYKRFFEKILND